MLIVWLNTWWAHGCLLYQYFQSPKKMTIPRGIRPISNNKMYMVLVPGRVHKHSNICIFLMWLNLWTQWIICQIHDPLKMPILHKNNTKQEVIDIVYLQDEWMAHPIFLLNLAGTHVSEFQGGFCRCPSRLTGAMVLRDHVFYRGFDFHKQGYMWNRMCAPNYECAH